MEFWNLSSEKVNNLNRNTPLIIPVAAVEQHSKHLPLATDSLLLGEVIARAQKQSSQNAYFLPLMWLGNSHHHIDFAGTLSAPPRVWIEILSALVENLIGHGFRRILVINGHGGNSVPINQSLFECRQKYRKLEHLLLLNATYWTLGDPTQTVLNWTQTEMGHACEWETSMMLTLQSNLVGDYQSLPDVPMQPAFEMAERAWITQERSVSGYIGNPKDATTEKGECLFDIFSHGLVELIRKIDSWNGTPW